MKVFNGLTAVLGLSLFLGATAMAVPGKSCKNFTGAWEGLCLKPDGKTENTGFTIYQKACDSIAFNGETFPMNQATMQVSEVNSGDGKTISFASETYPYWSDFGAEINVERHLVTVDPANNAVTHDLRMKENYQIGEGGKLVKSFTVNGQAVQCALTLKP